MTEAEVIYEQGNIKITNLRAIFGRKTYPVSNISAVKTETKPPSKLLPILFMITGGARLLEFAVSLYSNFNNANPIDWWSLFLGIGFLVGGAYIMRASQDERIVKVVTASGETKAYSSPDKQHIDKIIESLNTAINQAMIQQGQPNVFTNPSGVGLDDPK